MLGVLSSRDAHPEDFSDSAKQSSPGKDFCYILLNRALQNACPGARFTYAHALTSRFLISSQHFDQIIALADVGGQEIQPAKREENWEQKDTMVVAFR